MERYELSNTSGLREPIFSRQPPDSLEWADRSRSLKRLRTAEVVGSTPLTSTAIPPSQLPASRRCRRGNQ